MAGSLQHQMNNLKTSSDGVSQSQRKIPTQIKSQPGINSRPANSHQSNAQIDSEQSNTRRTLSQSRGWFNRGTKFKAGLKRMFDAAAVSDGQKGVRALRACIMREMKLAVKSTQEVVLSVWEVLELMKTPESELCSSCYVSITCDAVETEHHDSGWTITGELQNNRFCMCTQFKAVHKTKGTVWSDSTTNEDTCITASSRGALNHFWANHGDQFEVFDMHDFD